MSFHTIICYPLLYYSTEFHHSTSIGWAPWLCNSPLCMVRSQYSARWLQPERSAGSDLMGNFDHIFWEIYSGYDTVWDANMVSYDMISSLPGRYDMMWSDVIWCVVMWYDMYISSWGFTESFSRYLHGVRSNLIWPLKCRTLWLTVLDGMEVPVFRHQKLHTHVMHMLV